MVNMFDSIEAAEKSWIEDKSWMAWYWRQPNSAAICFDKSSPSDGYFIITHPMCVRYREQKGQVVKMLNPVLGNTN
jgi:type IV secretory pathway TraG/TraD family ATPase VirD4